MKKHLRAAVLLLALAACIPPRGAPETGVIEGKTLFQKGRVGGALVTAVRDLGVTGLERSYAARTDDEGRFRLTVPPGAYYLSFTRAPDLFGFFGGNPVNVRPGTPSQVALRGMRWSGKAEFVAEGDTGISGRAHREGEPIPGAVIQVFLDAANRFRGPGYAMATADPDGSFNLDLPPGRYFVLARQRHGAGRIGPLDLGDQYAWYPANPIYLPAGKRAQIDLPFLEVEKEPSQALAEASRGSLVSGTVAAPDGRPVTGVYACLYRGPEPMGMPQFVSDPTDAGGRFRIRVSGSGIFYLVARGSIGRPLMPDEYVAFYRGPAGHKIEVVTGRDSTGLVVPWEAP